MVDDGSTDGTAGVAAAPGRRVVAAASRRRAGSASRGPCSRASRRRAARWWSRSTPTRARGRASWGRWRGAAGRRLRHRRRALRVRHAGGAPAASLDARVARLPLRAGGRRCAGAPPGARDRQRPVHGGPPRAAARLRRLPPGGRAHDRRRGAGAGARGGGLERRVPRRRRPARGQDARLGRRDVAASGAGPSPTPT